MSATPKTDAILSPLLLMLQAATSNEDSKTATINVVRHAITHAKAMEAEAARLRGWLQHINQAAARENWHIFTVSTASAPNGEEVPNKCLREDENHEQ